MKLFNIENLKADMDVLQDKMEDLIQSSYWFLEDYFEDERLESKDDAMNHAFAYVEQKIKLNQSVTLLQTYKKEMDSMLLELDKEIQEIKKADTDGNQ
ncbi:type II toxin-antitoxin system toxin TscT [Mammaliicoccus lentus]|uniref:type II toxin-antitoxin system toxin TscT n=1 Tax=Mammaliicoccus lentus TaxID=42858 RepID=UPI002DB7D594|nr:DUF1474 family protein [Mammaliicoccus lentus]MEB5686665.1 DUF1474 family protein [Mammaliicoccus lentus]